MRNTRRLYVVQLCNRVYITIPSSDLHPLPGIQTPTLPLSITSQPFSMLPFPTSNKMIILTRSITWYDSKMMRNFNCVLYGLLQPRLEGISAWFSKKIAWWIVIKQHLEHLNKDIFHHSKNVNIVSIAFFIYQVQKCLNHRI